MTGAQVDHFPDVGKMVGDIAAGDFTGRFGLGNHVQEIVPLGVTEQMLDIARQPIFYAVLSLLGMGFKGARKSGDLFRFHG